MGTDIGGKRVAASAECSPQWRTKQAGLEEEGQPGGRTIERQKKARTAIDISEQFKKQNSHKIIFLRNCQLFNNSRKVTR